MYRYENIDRVIFIANILPSTAFRNAFSVSSNLLVTLFVSFVWNSFCMVWAVIEIKETVQFEESDIIVLMVVVLLQYNFVCCFMLVWSMVPQIEGGT